MQLNESVFAKPFNEALVHQIVVAYQLANRSGTKAQKSRSDVKGGGLKPWRQKGTGRARAGSTRSPIWRSGGVTFAATPKSWEQKINKKMYRGAMASIFSELIRQERLVVIDEIAINEPKTKQLLSFLSQHNLGSHTLLITEVIDLNLYLAARNLPHVQVLDVAGLDPVSLIHFEQVVITRDALKNVEEWLA